MAKKKSRKKSAALSKSKFKITGAHAKMKTVEKKKKLYYFKEKVSTEKATKIAKSEGPDILGVSASDVKIGRPSLKYDFYCIYDATLELSFLRKRVQEIGVNEQVKGALVGNEIYMPKKGKDVPGKSLKLDIIELFEITRNDGMILDGATGGPANALKTVLKGPGKKSATASWLKKSSIASGKYNSLEKVVRAVSKMAKQKPSDAKRVTSHSLTFNKLDGFYVPVYYISISAGAKKQVLKVNAINSAVSVKV